MGFFPKRETFQSITVRHCFLGALAVSAFQIAFLLTLAPHSGSLEERFLTFNNWDSHHYINIASTGYHIPTDHPVIEYDVHQDAANVVFFPSFPVLARSVSTITGASIPLSLVIVSDISCFFLWFFFFLLMKSYAIPVEWIGVATLSLLAYPGTFYFALGYTESLFTAALLAFIYFSDRAQVPGAVLSGFVATSTRIVGVAIAPYPILRRYAETKRFFLKDFVIGILSLSGVLAFFAYCQIHFEDWGIYFKLEELGWTTHRNVWAIFNPLSYLPRFFFEDTIASINRLAVTFMIFLFVVAYRMEKNATELWRRVGLYAVAIVLFYIAFTVKADAHMDSMLRYVLPPYVLFLLAFAQIWRRDRVFSRSWKTAAVLSFSLEIWLAFRFLHGKWVA